MARLDEKQLHRRLESLHGWSLESGAIQRRFHFDSFTAAIGFVNRVAEVAEAADHHPDIDVRYRDVTLTLSTHSEGGLTEKDFDLAAQIDQRVTAGNR